MFTRQIIAEIVEKISLVKDDRTLVNQMIQVALNRVSQYFDYPFYIQDRGVIETVDDYSTGTVEVTNGSTAITFTGATLTAGMAGRKIRFSGSNPYYRISSVNVGAGTAVLEYAYQGTTNATATYTIYRDEYRLAPDIKKYKTLRQAQNAITLLSLHPTGFDEIYPMPQSYADSVFEIMEGTLLDTYTTGTVTATGTTITGTSTAWTSVEGLGRMSLIRIGNNVYHVRTVDSATQITTYETLTEVSAASAYEITLDNLRVQFYEIPNAQRLYYYRYFRQPTPLSNDYDIPDMPHNWHHLLIYGALSEILSQKGDISKAFDYYEQKFLAGCEAMKKDIGSFTPDRKYRRKSVDRLTRESRLDGLEPSGFDRRWSS